MERTAKQTCWMQWPTNNHRFWSSLKIPLKTWTREAITHWRTGFRVKVVLNSEQLELDLLGAIIIISFSESILESRRGPRLYAMGSNSKLIHTIILFKTTTRSFKSRLSHNLRHVVRKMGKDRQRGNSLMIRLTISFNRQARKWTNGMIVVNNKLSELMVKSRIAYMMQAKLELLAGINRLMWLRLETP